MYTITKEFDFCYGHRVWSQQLNSEFSLDSCTACRHLHGHQGKIEINLIAETLERGMVTDFKHLNWFKKWLDDTLDHKFIIHKDDPLYTTLLPHLPKPATTGFPGVDMMGRYYSQDELSGCWSVRVEKLASSLGFTDSQKEMYEGYVIVDFVPTSENLTKWLFEVVEKKMGRLNIKVDSIKFSETPKSHAFYKPHKS